MEQKIIYDAVSGISEGYLIQSEQFSGVNAAFRRTRLRKAGAAALCCCALTGIAAFAFFRTGTVGRTEPAGTVPSEQTDTDNTDSASLSAAEQTAFPDGQTVPSAAVTDEQTAENAMTDRSAAEHGSTGDDPQNSTVTAAQTEMSGSQTESAQKPDTQGPPASGLSYQLFRSTLKADPAADAYGEDEIHRVVLYADGRQYRQADSDEPETLADYAAFPASGSVPASALGECLGRITELGVNNQPLKTPCSKEPSLAGAEVYEYAPAGSRAALIVRQGTQCSIFLYHGYLIGNGFADAFRFYNSEIAAVDYTVRTPAGGSMMQKTEEGSVTDAEKLAQIADVLKSLRMQEPLPQGIGTPQWEVDARAAYREDPAGKVREDISIVIRFANGTVMRNMEFQPYIGNGYFSGMEQMTAEQCKTLRALLAS